ncbi:MAG: hypothetical protein JRH20_02375 [Deltaproteobacteria bacterium]|nr:hypothetical protein [Deltaproteobacteria bacterium]
MNDLARISIIALALALCATPALAKKKVVVTAFSGPGGKKARAGLIRGLKRHARPISLRRYRRTADRLGLDSQSAEGRSAIAAKLKLSAIIAGRVKRARRGRLTLTITVYDGRSGDKLGRRTVKARKKRHLKRAGMKAAKRILRLLRRAEVGEAAAPPPEPTPEPEIKEDVAEVSKTEGENEGDEETELRAEAESGDRPRGWVQLSAAFGFAKRSYTLEAQTATNNREYDGGLYPEVTLALETYPLLLATTGPLTGLGLGATFTHHLSISTTQEASSEAVDSSSMELLFDLRYRWLFSDTPSGPVAYGLVGYGMRSFDLADNPTLTTFSYQFFNIALGGRMPLGTELIALEAEFSLRPILKAGQEAVEAFGERSGGLGLGIRTGLSGRLTMGLFYFATFEYLTFPSDFAGRESALRTIELTEPSSGSDSFIRLWTGVGYAL